MAEWIEPVTNRTSGQARMTYVDMNRIAGNLDYLVGVLADINITAQAPSKTDWTQNDIVSIEDWQSITESLDSIRSGLQFAGAGLVDNQMTYTNINELERLTLEAYTRWQQLENGTSFNLFVGDGVATGVGAVVEGMQI